jgi:hypothetical protein
MARVSAVRVSSVSCSLLSDFYREEFLKHRACLARQREYYSERAITDADGAIALVLKQLDSICAKDNAQQVMSRLLRSFDIVTGLSALEPRQLH